MIKLIDLTKKYKGFCAVAQINLEATLPFNRMMQSRRGICGL